MDLTFYYITAKDTFLNTPRAWKGLQTRIPSIGNLAAGFLLPVILLISISAFAGTLLFTNSRFTILFPVLTATGCFVQFWLAVLTTFLAMKILSRKRGINTEANVLFSLLVFSLVPFFICQLLSRLFESLLFVNILAIFSIYIFWAGEEKLLDISNENKSAMLIASSLTFFATYAITGLIFDKTAEKLYYLLVG